MKADEALLLPSLHKEFENEAVANLFVSLTLVHDVSKYIPTSCWLLLSNTFIVLWEPNCCHKRYSTLLFHKSCDLDISPFYSTWQEQKHPETCWELLAPKPQVQKQELSIEEHAGSECGNTLKNGKATWTSESYADFNKRPENTAGTNLATV